MSYNSLVWVTLAYLLLSCSPSQNHAEVPASPLVDGSSAEYAALGAQTMALGHDVTLYIYQDAHYVWVCYDFPEGSFGTLDMVLTTAQLDEPLNLHVSAQLGEWPANHPDQAPQTPDSDAWWNTRGWIANPIWFNGLNTTTNPARARFKKASARELQLSKSRFGTGEWRIQLNINAIRTSDGKFAQIKFPEEDEGLAFQVD